jgi:hypothetical protein
MNIDKILLYIYDNETRLKKYKLDIGEYSVGNDVNEADIVIDNE